MKKIPVLALLIVLNGCINDPATGPPDPPPPSARGVYILNEGGFGQGNATLSYLDLDSGTVSNDVFAAVNLRPLGDVGNSIQIRNGLAYIVVNNSHKIEIIGVTDHRSTGTIDMGTGRSPRQMAFVNDSVALVTNLYDNSVVPVNVKTGVLLPRIPVGSNPDGIALAGGKAFVALSGGGSGTSVAVISLSSLTVTDTVTVLGNPGKVHVSSEGEVYVLCTGSFSPETPAGIVVIDPQTVAVVDTIPLGEHVFEFALTTGGRGYIPLTDSVLTLDTRTRSVIGTFARGTSFYALGVDPVSGDVYAGDARNFVQPGSVTVFNSAGAVQRSFDVGIIPGSFAFRH
jgi:DNA-binding beta-propeller fold protein YncE